MDKIDLRPRPSAEVALIRELVGAVPFAQPFLNYFSALAGSEVGEVATAIKQVSDRKLGVPFRRDAGT